MSMGKRICDARKNKGYTQEYVASQLGVSRQAVFKWEKEQTCPDTSNLIALAELLDTSVDYLARGKQETKAGSCDADRYFKASLLPLCLMPICWLIGVFSGVYTDMVEIPVSKGLRMGVPFLMYGHSPFAIALVAVSAVCFIMFLLMLFLGHQANKD